MLKLITVLSLRAIESHKSVIYPKAGKLTKYQKNSIIIHKRCKVKQVVSVVVFVSMLMVGCSTNTFIWG